MNNQLTQDQIGDVYQLIYKKLSGADALESFDLEALIKQIYKVVLEATEDSGKALQYAQAVPDIFNLVTNNSKINDILEAINFDTNIIRKLRKQFQDLEFVNNYVNTTPIKVDDIKKTAKIIYDNDLYCSKCEHDIDLQRNCIFINSETSTKKLNKGNDSYYLFFDTETTGLPKNWKAPVTDLENWPRLVQLAYLIYDFDGNLIHSSNEIIKPNGFTIPLDAFKVHGISTDVANQRGNNIENVLKLFYIHLKQAKVIVAHNMAYDEKIIGSEFIRLGIENILEYKEKICTMESTVNLCKIKGPYGYKWPKLEELYLFIFKNKLEFAHDALVDIKATAKCFWELMKMGVFKSFIGNKSNNIHYLDKSHECLILAKNKNFDVPFLTIDIVGIETWKLYNTKLDIKHHYFEYHEISDIMNSRIEGEEDLWNNIYYQVSYWGNVIIYNNEKLWVDKWMDWEIKDYSQLFYKGEFILEIPKFISNNWDLEKRKIEGFKFLNSENNISKVIAHYRDFTQGVFTKSVFEEFYFSLFYIDQNGFVFAENNQLEFETDLSVPFFKIDKNGDSSWQFYNIEKDLFFGKIFKNHFEVENEIKSTIKSEFTNFWNTTFTPINHNHLIGLSEWEGWKTNENGDLLYNEKIKLNIFDLNLDLPFADAPPILRFLESDNHISKLIVYCNDDEYYWYETLFYIDSKGVIFLENHYKPPKKYDLFDAWEAFADFEAGNNFYNDDLGLMPYD